MDLVRFDQLKGVLTRAETAEIFVRRFGNGYPILLLHGFPETQLMWRSVAPLLATQFTVICADLPGYGESGIPVSRADHGSSSKRAMANDLLIVMEELGFSRFSVAGHDCGRGGVSFGSRSPRADGSPELMPAGSALQAAAGQDTNMRAVLWLL
jgi:haloacetate dehalogenase